MLKDSQTQSNSRTHGSSIQFLKSSLSLNRIITLSFNNGENLSINAFSNYKTSLPIQYCFAIVIKALIQKSLTWLLLSES